MQLSHSPWQPRRDRKAIEERDSRNMESGSFFACQTWLSDWNTCMTHANETQTDSLFACQQNPKIQGSLASHRQLNWIICWLDETVCHSMGQKYTFHCSTRWAHHHILLYHNSVYWWFHECPGIPCARLATQAPLHRYYCTAWPRLPCLAISWAAFAFLVSCSTFWGMSLFVWSTWSGMNILFRMYWIPLDDFTQFDL